MKRFLPLLAILIPIALYLLSRKRSGGQSFLSPAGISSGGGYSKGGQAAEATSPTLPSQYRTQFGGYGSVVYTPGSASLRPGTGGISAAWQQVQRQLASLLGSKGVGGGGGGGGGGGKGRGGSSGGKGSNDLNTPPTDNYLESTGDEPSYDAAYLASIDSGYFGTSDNAFGDYSTDFGGADFSSSDGVQTENTAYDSASDYSYYGDNGVDSGNDGFPIYDPVQGGGADYGD